jgi:hypothetical protein
MVVGSVFEASRLKVSRAQRHFNELQSQITAYLSKKPFRAVIEDDGPGRQCVTFRVSKPVPKELSAIIGDAIHNLRAALDLLACEIVRLNGQSDDRVQFPFCDVPEDLEKEIKRRYLDRAVPAAVDLVRALKPYKDGNIELRALHDLDIQDKHRMLIPVADWADFGKAQFGGISLQGGGQHFGPVQDGFSLFKFDTDPKFRLGQTVKATYHFTLGPLLPLGNRDLVPAIQSLIRLVKDTIDDFERVLSPSPQNN